MRLTMNTQRNTFGGDQFRQTASPASISYLHFNTDSGHRDLGRVKSYPRDTDFNVVFEDAIVLAKRYGSNGVLVVKTKPYQKFPGAWYIKGFDGQISYQTILHTVEENHTRGLHRRRDCYLISVPN